MTTPPKRKKPHGKGSAFERSIAKTLSLWWTAGADPHVFWRSQNSGGRATTHRKQGGKLSHQTGDIAATKPVGVPLLDLVAIECKRGYKSANPFDVADMGSAAAIQAWEKQVAQAHQACEHAGSYSWLLITRRNGRESFVWLPRYLRDDLRAHGAFTQGQPRPSLSILTTIRLPGGPLHFDLWGCCLREFLDVVPPNCFLDLLENA